MAYYEVSVLVTVEAQSDADAFAKVEEALGYDPDTEEGFEEFYVMGVEEVEE